MADRVAEVPFGESAALVRPDAFSGAEDTGGTVSGKQSPPLARGLRQHPHRQAEEARLFLVLIRPHETAPLSSREGKAA